MKFFSKSCLITAIMLLVFCMVSDSLANEWLGFCTESSKNMLDSCKFGAQDDYWLALAKCNNIPNAEKRSICKSNAAKDLTSMTQDCQDQFEVRLEICDGLGEKAYNPIIKPADFVDVIDNQFFPLKPGTTFVYEGMTEKGKEHIKVNVTHNTKKILGVTCIEVRDTVTVDGVLVEDTLDWYAQDKEGNVWYFGENSGEFEDGLIVSLECSGIAGVDGEKPGIIMKAHPQVGDLYRQEFSLDVAEDMAKVLKLNGAVTVPYGSSTHFTNCLRTKEFTPLEPDAVENKFYAKDIGNIRTVDVATGDHVDLIDILTE